MSSFCLACITVSKKDSSSVLENSTIPAKYRDRSRPHLSGSLAGIFSTILDSTVRTCLHSLEEASDGKYPGATRARALESDGAYCVEVAGNRVISNNTITPNNRVYTGRDRRAAAAAAAAPLHLFRPGAFSSKRDATSIERLIHPTTVSRAWLEINRIFQRHRHVSSKCNSFLVWRFMESLICQFVSFSFFFFFFFFIDLSDSSIGYFFACTKSANRFWRVGFLSSDLLYIFSVSGNYCKQFLLNI